MRSFRQCVLLICVLLLLRWAGAQESIDEILKRNPVMNPNFSAFTESSLMSYASRLEAPAGKHGFVTVKDGHFVYADGMRARFFGINLAKDTVFIEKPQIDRLVALFARAGVNLVRIHHIDDTQGILDSDPARYFRPERLDLVDYWVAKLKERGIYLCLDLNDYRTFKASEGVRNGEQLGRGAKPYAVFDQRLIELQQEYARKLLIDHVNPYTKLAYANDPAIAFLEIYDENGLFIRRGDWATLREPYRKVLQDQWNIWLRVKYGTTAGLKSAWTDRNGFCALGATESLDTATVMLPRLELDSDVPAGPTNPLIAPARTADGARFAYDIQLSYLQTMMDALHEMGIKVPVTAVGAQDVLPDLMATAKATDYIGINFYWDHPTWDAGKEWTMPAYFSLNNPITDNQSYSFTATCSLAHMQGKPLVVRELGYCFPNAFRGAGMIESAAYGAFLDIDALILFTFDAHSNARTIGYFDIHLDPLRWGLASQCARLFLSGDVRPSLTTTGIGFSDVDAFTWYEYLNSLYQLANVTRVVNTTDRTTPNPFNLLITSGRSSGPQWAGNHLLFFANKRHVDTRYKTMSDAIDAQYGYSFLTGRSGVFDMTFRGYGYDAGTVKTVQAWPVFATDDLKNSGVQPVATANTAAYGFYDPTRQLFGFRNLRPELATRVALDALHLWNNVDLSHTQLDRGVWVSDTGELIRDTANGCLKVDTLQLQVIAGRFDQPIPPRTSALSLVTTTPIGTLTAESLDGKALTDSTSFVVEMTSKARNDLMGLAPVEHGSSTPKAHRLERLGTPPIRTDGKAVIKPTRVSIGDRMLLELYLQNGTWEYLQQGNRALLYLDTGDITVRLPSKPALVRWHTAQDVIEMSPPDVVFTIPNGVRYTEIIWPAAL